MYRNRFIEKLRIKEEREDLILALIAIILGMFVIMALGMALVIFLISPPK